MQIVLTLKVYLVNDLQNPHIKIPIWQDTHVYETQISGVTVLQRCTMSMLFINKGLQVLDVTLDL